MNEIEKTPQGEMIPTSDPHPSVEYVRFLSIMNGEPLRITANTPGVDYLALVNTVVQTLDFANIAKDIKRGEQFIVQFKNAADELLYRSGTAEFMENAQTHMKYPVLRYSNEKGKPIAAQMELVIRNGFDPQQIHALAASANNALLSIQLQQMNNKLDELSKNLKDVLQEFENIRQSLIESGVRKIVSGFRNEDTGLLTEGRSSLYDGLIYVKNTLATRAKQFQKIPKTLKGREWMLISSPKVYEECRTRYSEMEDLFLVFLFGSKLLAASYLAQNNSAEAECVLSDAVDMLHSIDFRNVQTLEYDYPGLATRGFHRQYETVFVEAQQNLLEAGRQSEYFEIEFSAERILTEEASNED